MIDLSKQRLERYHRGELSFDLIDSGPLEGEAVVLLHGFPETAQCWDQVRVQLNAAGFRTFAPNQRGYSLDARPEGRQAYRMQELLQDLDLLIDQINQPVHLVGHDWGAIVAWEYAMHYPKKLKNLVVLSVPHPGAFLRALLASDQLFKSYYIGLFQLPKLPELLFEKFPKIGLGLLKNSGMTKQQLEIFKTEMLEQGRLSYSLNWYRALPFNARFQRFDPVTVPTLFIGGTQDVAISDAGVKLNQRYVQAPYREVMLEANHWLPVQQAAVVSQLILEQIQA
ncbi:MULTISPECIES: alpha/beta fold hydrolase [Acinetobacter]|jgi:pimeloyl-ACP methyl ester carboxylesterase|uniref:alpha/beta fold hydrolase n=1 Tax=Acinetobacter TaxID=469 RepID=UPI000445C62B|nr:MULTISPECIES: alpha/beta fold hydrolase [Acinetobacter]AWV85055.1 alpha/beta hydrolase [Acinetobacter radioresistens]EXF57432.1 alpha/beta hydrolase fold family protein [Acinetobacter sp. 1294596]KCX37576.1 alpha/beta hydrolase fold family protein [Acinetobacter sp. 263903-1]MCK4089984.1 alpha/beta fold hydrolase [Acinetobacter radioresistens]MCK4099414.1 alpha/beta fold hydrolase [Acinetobacter radioresistens]